MFYTYGMGRLVEDEGTTRYTSDTTSKTPEQIINYQPALVDTSYFSQALDWAKSAFSSVAQTVNQYTSQAQSIINQGYDNAWAKVEEAKTKMQEAIEYRQEIDSLIARLPAGADRDRVIKKKQESEGLFSQYVLPAWTSFSNLVGVDSNPARGVNEKMTLGAVPIVPVGVVVAALALSYVASQYIDLQREILNDPSLSALQRSSLLSQFSFGALTGNLKYLGIGAAVLGAAFLVYKLRK